MIFACDVAFHSVQCLWRRNKTRQFYFWISCLCYGATSAVAFHTLYMKKYAECKYAGMPSTIVYNYTKRIPLPSSRNAITVSQVPNCLLMKLSKIWLVHTAIDDTGLTDLHCIWSPSINLFYQHIEGEHKKLVIYMKLHFFLNNLYIKCVNMQPKKSLILCI